MSARVRSVESRDNPLLVRLRKLAADPTAYRKLAEVWIEGEHLCASFVRSGGAPSHAVITDAAWQVPELADLARAAADVTIVPAALMAGLTTLESSPPLCFVLPWSGPGALEAGRPSVVLDRLQDPGNVGNVLRSAAAFGFTQVIALKNTAALWSPKVLRAGMGAHFGLKLVEAVSEDELDRLQMPMIATSSHADQAVHQALLPWPCAWVLGHEGQGISAGLVRRCATTLRIPLPGGEESLNVAAAAAVCLYESVRQRDAGR